MWILYSLGSALFTSLGFVAESYLVSQRNTKSITGARYLVPSARVNLAIVVLFLLFQPDQLWFVWSLLSVAALLAIGLIDTWYNALAMRALEQASASQVNPILAISPLITLIVTTLLPTHQASWRVALVAVLIVLGVYLIQNVPTKSFDLASLTAPFRSRTFKFAITSATCIGISTLLVSFVLQQHYASSLTLLLLRVLIIVIYSSWLFKTPFFAPGYSKLQWIAMMVGIEIFYVTERWLRFLALANGNVVIVSSIVSTAPLFVLLFSLLFFREKLTWNKALGTLLIVAGIISIYL